MTPEEASDLWTGQEIPSVQVDKLNSIVRRESARSNRRFIASILFASVCLAFGVFNFYGQYVINGDGLLVASLRAMPVVVAIFIQAVVYRRTRQTYHERERLVENQRAWIAHRVDHLQKEARGEGRWKLGLFFTFVTTVLVITKWLDYIAGQDSLAECVGIVTIVVCIFGVFALSIWHRRTQFVVPELARHRKMLDDLNSEL